MQCLLGYYNPILSYGEDDAIAAAAEAGVEGFILVDVPPEEAVRFRERCKAHWSAPRTYLSTCSNKASACLMSH
jgi:tryptophan synthase alpha subunit